MSFERSEGTVIAKALSDAILPPAFPSPSTRPLVTTVRPVIFRGEPARPPSTEYAPSLPQRTSVSRRVEADTRVDVNS